MEGTNNQKHTGDRRNTSRAPWQVRRVQRNFANFTTTRQRYWNDLLREFVIGCKEFDMEGTRKALHVVGEPMAHALAT